MADAWEQEKNRGARLFRSGDFHGAKAAYVLALRASPPDEQAAKIHSNASLCALRLKQYDECIEHATGALGSAEMAPKALYRRARARFALGDLVESVRDAKTLLSIRPDNKEAVNFLAMVRKAVENSESGVAKVFSEAFEEKSSDKLKQVLGSIAENESRAKELAFAPQCAKRLVELAGEFDIVFAILSRLADFPSTRLLVASPEVFDIVEARAMDISKRKATEMLPLYSTACLLAYARVLFAITARQREAFAKLEEKRRAEEKHSYDIQLEAWKANKQEIESSGVAYVGEARPTFAYKQRDAPPCVSPSRLAVFTRSLDSPTSGHREVAVEAISRICGDGYTAHANCFVVDEDGLLAVGRLAGVDPQLASVVLGRPLSARKPIRALVRGLTKRGGRGVCTKQQPAAVFLPSRGVLPAAHFQGEVCNATLVTVPL